ncbi:hypothetical protein SAMN04515667_1934 [Formosa sp. Hel1_31_208]|nr:hypothetical protein SAMN04515667_1934 [Formosa sp. Hel1_31_208]
MVCSSLYLWLDLIILTMILSQYLSLYFIVSFLVFLWPFPLDINTLKKSKHDNS